MINTRYKIKFFYSAVTIFNAPRFVIFVAGPVTIKAAANTTLCAIINFDITPGRYPFIKQKITANIGDSCILWHFQKMYSANVLYWHQYFLYCFNPFKGGVSIFELYELRQLITLQKPALCQKQLRSTICHSLRWAEIWKNWKKIWDWLCLNELRIN